MSLTAEKEYKYFGTTAGAADHDYDLVHELSRRLELLWRSDQSIANAEGKPALQEFWRDVKRQEQHAVARLKDLIRCEIDAGCF